jgi:hypothetical protein
VTRLPDELEAEPDRSAVADDGTAEGADEPTSSFVRGAQMQPNTFVSHVASAVSASFAQHEPPLQVQQRGRLAKFWFGPNSNIHYEIWLHERTLQLELGLHFEATPEFNSLLLKAFDRYLLEIQATLGSSIWLEEWDHGWARLYETHPLFPLDGPRVEQVAERLSRIMGVLQPMLDNILTKMPPVPEPIDRRQQWLRKRR